MYTEPLLVRSSVYTELIPGTAARLRNFAACAIRESATSCRRRRGVQRRRSHALGIQATVRIIRLSLLSGKNDVYGASRILFLGVTNRALLVL